jgi:hypothetical protein
VHGGCVLHYLVRIFANGFLKVSHMMGQMPPGSSSSAPPKPLGKATPEVDLVSRNRISHFHRPSALLRGLSFFAPVAAAYASFQAVLSSLPPSLSYANMHYLLAVVSGVAAGALVGCGMLLVQKVQPESQAEVLAGPTARPLGKAAADSTRVDVPDIARSCYETLLDTVVSFDDPQLGRLTGWPHFLHEAAAGYRPTAFGTAYGLKLALALGIQDGRLDRAALTETLWKLRRVDGAWASRTQGAVGRPEATAVTLGALAAAGCDSAKIAKAGDVFESMVAPEADTAAMTSTFVVASIIRELVRIRPHSPRLAQLRTILLNGTIEDPRYGNMTCWSARLDKSRLAVPSTAHTALAVVALARLRKITDGDDNQLRLTLEQAVGWLALDTNLESETAQIRRFVTADHWESLTVNLFTAAWVARALMAVTPNGIPTVEEHLYNAIKKIMNTQHDGIWEWGDGNRPLWMTYQGFSTLQVFALSRWTTL